MSFGTDPTLLQDLDIVTEIQDVPSSTKIADENSNFEETARRMQIMYKNVHHQQASMAARNQANRAKIAKDVEYNKDELVLLW